MESEIDLKRVGLLALRMMTFTFVAIIAGWIAVDQVHAKVITVGYSAGRIRDLPDGPSVPSLALAESGVVRVSSGNEFATTVGTGFAIGNCILTNDHVISGSSFIALGRAESTVQSSLETWGSIVATSSESDVAVVEGGEGPTGPSATLASGEVVVGQPVVMLGYKGGRKLVRVEGLVHAQVDGAAYGIAGSVVLIDQRVAEGMSGGPVLNGDGEVVAMLSRVDQLTDLTVAIPATSLRTALASEQAKGIC